MNKKNIRGGKPKPNGRIQIDSKAREIVSNTQLKSDKLQAMNNELMSKIDDILIQYKGQEKLIPDILQNSISTNNQSDIINIFDDMHMSTSIPSSAPSKKEQLPKIVQRKSAKIEKIPIGKGPNPFMTDVGLVKATKKRKNPEKKKNNQFLARTDKEINDIINNVDEIDTMYNENSDNFEGSPEFKSRMEKESEDFKNLLQEIDDYKRLMHEEFDEVKYLIKFANNTHKLIDRHKTVITSIFKGAGLKSKSEQKRENSQMKKNDPYNRNNRNDSSYNELMERDGEDEDEYDDGDIDNNIENFDAVFNKLKKINQIKDNLSNIQDDFLGYHEKFKTNINQIQKIKENEDTKP